MKKNILQVGINLGGWISQYPAYEHRHFQSFIIKDDITRIADWGFDHVRLPIDYPVLENDENPGQYLEQGFSYIDNCVHWCEENGLNIIIDLHKAPGYAFDDLGKASLFNDIRMQQRLINIWQAIASRYGEKPNRIALELLNEITLSSSDPWNALYPKLIDTIRPLAPQSLIIIGGNQYNAADQMQYLQILDDDNILYTFHHYSPLVVTHYHAPWLNFTEEYRHMISYPGQGKAPEPGFMDRYPQWNYSDEFSDEVYFDKVYQAEKILPALDFSRKINQPVYCGEFGVIDVAPLQNRLNWTRDFIELLIESKVGRALWSYKALDFGLVDGDGKVVSEELVKIAAMTEE